MSPPGTVLRIARWLAPVCLLGCAQAQIEDRDLSIVGLADFATERVDLASGNTDGGGGSVDLATSPADMAKGPCTGGNVNMVDPGTDHCYRMFTPVAAWTAAKTLCEGLGAGNHLVTITTAAENTFVRGLIGATLVWIGATDVPVENTFTWVTGEAFVYTAWGMGQPNDAQVGADEDCVGMFVNMGQGVWFDDDCAVARSYVCERD